MITPENSFEQFLVDLGVNENLIEISKGDMSCDSRLILSGQVDKTIIDHYCDGHELVILVVAAPWSPTGNWTRETSPVMVPIDGEEHRLYGVCWDSCREEFVVSISPSYPFDRDDGGRKTVMELRAAIDDDSDQPKPNQPVRPPESESALRRMRRFIQELAINSKN